MRITAIARIEYKNDKGQVVEALPNQTFHMDDVEANKLISIGAARTPTDGEAALAEKIESSKKTPAKKSTAKADDKAKGGDGSDTEGGDGSDSDTGI